MKESLEFKTKLINLLKDAKQMKKAIVTFQDGFLLGTDETFSSLSVVHYNEDVHDLFKIPYFKNLRLTFVLNELIAFMKSFDIMSDNFIIDKYGISDKNVNGNTLLNNIVYQMRIDDIHMKCLSYRNYIGNHTIKAFDIRQDKKFNELLNMKKNEGSSMYILQGRYPMSTFSSIHPVTKTDKMTVDIFELSEYHTFLSLFTIFKKTVTIEEYILYRDF